MKHFLVEITYNVPVLELGEAVAEHRVFLKVGFERGWLLYSGPQEPRKGGIVMARAQSLLDLERFFAEDIYARRGLATYRYVEFTPLSWQPFLEDWVKESSA